MHAPRDAIGNVLEHLTAGCYKVRLRLGIGLKLKPVPGNDSDSEIIHSQAPAKKHAFGPNVTQAADQFAAKVGEIRPRRARFGLGVFSGGSARHGNSDLSKNAVSVQARKWRRYRPSESARANTAPAAATREV